MDASDLERSGLRSIGGGAADPVPATSGVFEDDGGFALRATDGTAYRVDICNGVFRPDQPLLSEYCEGRQIVVFISPAVDRLYGAQIRRYFGARRPEDSWSAVVIPTGEHRKTMASVEQICAVAARERLDRRGLMVAVGGGIICDLVGFAASIYARGIDYIKVNTTLVGQVDVGVGIKTGVNAMHAKNMLGAYHPARASVNDTALLATLPRREIRCGISEIIKMAIIRGGGLFDSLDRNRHTLLPDDGGVPALPPGPHTESVVRTAMRLMLEELRSNLREYDLARLVDFGHSFSPVIEMASDYRIKHGEAVAIDMALSSVIARSLGLLPPPACERILTLLEQFGLPVFEAQVCVPDLMLHALHASWLRRGRRLHLVLPTGLGAATFLHDLEDLPPIVVSEALETLSRRAAGVRTTRWA